MKFWNENDMLKRILVWENVYNEAVQKSGGKKRRKTRKKDRKLEKKHSKKKLCISILSIIAKKENRKGKQNVRPKIDDCCIYIK